MQLCSVLEINDVVLYCIALHFIALNCIALNFISLHCIVLQCLSQDLDFFKKELLKFFRELFAKERSYSSRAKIVR